MLQNHPSFACTIKLMLVNFLMVFPKSNPIFSSGKKGFRQIMVTDIHLSGQSGREKIACYDTIHILLHNGYAGILFTPMVNIMAKNPYFFPTPQNAVSAIFSPFSRHFSRGGGRQICVRAKIKKKWRAAPKFLRFCA